VALRGADGIAVDALRGADGIAVDALRGADGIAVDALRADPLAAPALDGVVEAEEDRAARREGVQRQPEQHARRGSWVPGGAVGDAAGVHEPPLPGEPGDPQDAGDRALPWRQDGADQ
jgi:hypothetical protein